MKTDSYTQSGGAVHPLSGFLRRWLGAGRQKIRGPMGEAQGLGGWQGMVVGVVAVVAFHVACGFAAWGWLVVLYTGGVFMLRRLGTARKAFYGGLVLGIAVFGPQLAFFATLFGPAAAVLWVILAFWTGLFVLLLHGVEKRWGSTAALVVAPMVWCGLEYFRSELYYLRFSWLTVGAVLAPELAGGVWAMVGVYGTGGLVMGVSAAVALAIEPGSERRVSRIGRWVSGVWLCVALGVAMLGFGLRRETRAVGPGGAEVEVAGVQLEFPAVAQVLEALNALVHRHPGVDLVLLSEYTFDGPVPEEIREWCKREGRYLVAGGKVPVEGGQEGAGGQRFYNTAFVVNPAGEVEFQQVKSVPIQFFADGLPAREQGVWASPWGGVGIAVCYDLSYTRVTDVLARRGVAAIVAPSMDVESWGWRQHEMNARIALIRAWEYGLPVLRVASSGVSLLTDGGGRVLARGSYPGPGEVVWARQRWSGPRAVGVRGGLPLDRVGGPVSVLGAGLVAMGLAGARVREGWRGRKPTAGRLTGMDKGEGERAGTESVTVGPRVEGNAG